LNILKKIFQNQLFKASSLSSFSIIIRLVTGFVSSKVIAHFIGPSGMALMGNLRSFSSLLDSIGALGVQSGVLQNVAKNHSDKILVADFVRKIFWILIIVSLSLSLLLIFGNSFIGNLIFNQNYQYYFVLYFIAFLLPFQILHLFFITVLNGLSYYKKVTQISIYGYIMSLLISFVLIWFYGINGALVSLSISSFFLFLFSSYFFFKAFPFQLICKEINVDFSILKGLIPFGIMSLFTAIVTPIIYIFIRNSITNEVSIEASGWFEAMQRISGFYFMFISTLVSFYFLPEMIKANSDNEKLSLTKKFFYQVIPIFLLALIAIYFCKDYIIKLLLTPNFSQVRNLFFWQLLGDLFKALSLILGIRFYVLKDVKGYLITESISFIVFFITAFFFIPLFGATGAVLSYAVTYFIYLLVLIFYFRKVIFKS
jgi:O-antigen/teichoic acid export membrane protein